MDAAVVVVVVAIIAVALVDVALVGVVGGVGRPNGRREADPTAEGWTDTATQPLCKPIGPTNLQNQQGQTINGIESISGINDCRNQHESNAIECSLKQ